MAHLEVWRERLKRDTQGPEVILAKILTITDGGLLSPDQLRLAAGLEAQSLKWQSDRQTSPAKTPSADQLAKV